MENKKVAVMIANGFEEGEALLTVDIIRRAGIECDMVSIDDNDIVTGCHNITVQIDKKINDIEKDSYDMIVLPGGLPGADNLRDSEKVIDWVKRFANNPKKYVAAICAAPQVLLKADVVKGKKVTSYPTDKYRKLLSDTHYVDDEIVVVDGNIITSRGPATTMPFAYQLVELLGKDSSALKEGMLYNSLCDYFKNKV